MPSENEIAVEQFWGPFWSKGDLSVAEAIFDPGFRDIDPQWPQGADGRIPALLEGGGVGLPAHLLQHRADQGTGGGEPPVP